MTTTEHRKRAVVVNFFAGPGAGKSTSKAGLFFLMKQRGFKVETVDEYAKEKTYEGGGLGMNQLYLTAKQDLRLRRLEHQVDFILSDSPLLISIAYADGIYGEGDYASLVTRLFDSYQNFNVWVRRTKPYQAYGRSQTESEARVLDQRLRALAGERIHMEVDGNEHAPGKVLEALTSTHIMECV